MIKIKGRNSKDIGKELTKKSKKYYKIIESKDIESNAVGTGDSLQKNVEEISNLLRNKHKFVYIDLSEQKGFRQMQACDDSEVEEQTEQIGNSYISKLNNLSQYNSKAISFIFQQKEDRHKKQSATKLFADELKKSTQKIKKLKRVFFNTESPLKKAPETQIHIYKGMPNDVIEKLMLDSQSKSINETLWQKQSDLIKNYNTVSTHRVMIKPDIQARKVRKSKLNSYLPQIFTKQKYKI